MQLVLDNNTQREIIYKSLLAGAKGTSNQHYIASILSSYCMDMSDMPANLGLEETEFLSLVDDYFPQRDIELNKKTAKPLDEIRNDEYQELLDLLLAHRSHTSDKEPLLAKVIVSGCMGSDHLWQDLGLWSRADLSAFIAENFASLAEKNTKNMKWKRFFYKQLCDAEGIYVCRSPSCEVCTDYSVCFAPEGS